MMTIEEKYLAFGVYETLQKVLEYRKLELVTGNYSKQKSDWLKKGEFINTIQNSGYIIIEAADSKEKRRRYRKQVVQANREKSTRTFFLIFDIGATPEKTADVIKIIDKLTDTRGETNIEIVIIYDLDMEIKKNTIKKLEEKKSNGKDDGTEGYLCIDYYSYTIFLTNIFDHVGVFPHEIVTTDEKKILEQLHCKKEQLPKLLRTEPPCVYIGAEIGDIVSVKIPSESCGTKIEYRTVVPPIFIK